MTKSNGLDFWSLLNKVNEYDRWLSDRLCELENGMSDKPHQYNTFKKCRDKLQELLK